MKNYHICQVGNVCLIFSVSYQGPLEFLDDIENELRSTPHCTKIIFDLLLSHGMNSNRYFEAIFDGNKLINIQKCDKVENTIKQASASFYQMNSALLDNSVLVKPQKFLIAKKLYSYC